MTLSERWTKSLDRIEKECLPRNWNRSINRLVSILGKVPTELNERVKTMQNTKSAPKRLSPMKEAQLCGRWLLALNNIERNTPPAEWERDIEETTRRHGPVPAELQPRVDAMRLLRLQGGGK